LNGKTIAGFHCILLRSIAKYVTNGFLTRDEATRFKNGKTKARICNGFLDKEYSKGR
jgi:hypothetical protein